MKTEINCAVLGSEICVEIVDVRLGYFALLLLPSPSGATWLWLRITRKKKCLLKKKPERISFCISIKKPAKSFNLTVKFLCATQISAVDL